MTVASPDSPDAAIWIDGEPCDRVPADDRGLQYGDGLFETIRLEEGVARHWERHLARLERGCERLGMPSPSRAALTADRDAAARRQSHGVLKIVVTRGSGGRGYAPPSDPVIRRITSTTPLPDWRADDYSRGIRIAVCETRAAISPELAGLKHLGRLENVLARDELRDSGWSEGIMLDDEGRVVGATMSNLFVTTEGRLMTPPVDYAGVAGTTRERVLAWARQAGVEVSESELTVADCRSADEIFLCNAVRGIIPVRELAGRPIPQQSLTRRAMRGIGETRDLGDR